LELLACPPAPHSGPGLAEEVSFVKAFQPRLDILPPSQRALWPKLVAVRERFILYGGTALALHLGHRASVDFDFFSFQPFEVESLRRSASWIWEAETLQAEPNTLTVLHRGAEGLVKVSFFGGLTFGTVGEPEETADGILRLAGLPDLFATKLNTVYQRAEAKDYLDIYALLKSGLSLTDGLRFSKDIYGADFNTLLPLQALCYFQEPSLRELPEEVKETLVESVRSASPPHAG
jgi:hypothetical protein